MNPFVVSHNFEQAVGLLQQLSDKYTNLAPVMRQVAGTMADASEQAFADEADPTTGEAWAELSDDYLEQNPDRADGQILQDSGQLAASISQDFGDFWAQISSNKRQAALQNLGGTPDMAPGPAAVPARAYMGLGASDTDQIVEDLKSYLTL